MKAKRPIAMIAAAAALSSCGTIGDAASALWPFGGGDQKREPQEGRVSILAAEQALTPSSQLAQRTIVVPAPSPAGDWTQPGGVATNAPIHIPGPQSGINVSARRDIGHGSNDRVRLAAPPVIANGRLFFIDADHVVRSFDVSSGRRQWERRLRPEQSNDETALGGGVATDGQRIYVTTGFGFAVALDAATGNEIWRTRAGAPFHSAPTVSGGRVFAVTNDSELFAFDAATGAVEWTHQSIAEPARILAASSPGVSGDTVIAPFASGEVVALLGANGRRLWTDALSRAGRLTSLSAINDIAGRPAIDNGVVYAASHSGVLAAIDLRTGQRVWSRSFASTQTPWIAGDVLFAVTVDGELAAFNRTDGGVYWVRQLRRFENQNDRTGRVAWTGPILAGGRLILANSLGEVAAVSPMSGEVIETRDVGDPIFIPPIAANGSVFFVTDGGQLIELR